MPSKANNIAAVSGDLEQHKVMLLSDAVKEFGAKKLNDSIIIVLPDTGKAVFRPSADYTVTSGKDKGQVKRSKARFKLAESAYNGDSMGALTQDLGDHKGLALNYKIEVWANAIDPTATCVEDAIFVPGKPVETGASNGQSQVIS